MPTVSDRTRAKRKPSECDAEDKFLEPKFSYTKVEIKFTSNPTKCLAPKCTETMFKTKKPKTPPEPYKNVMHDKRVYRGPMFISQRFIKEEQIINISDVKKAREERARKWAESMKRAGTPPPVAGRSHMDIQTDKYLEDLYLTPPKAEQGTQSDFYLQEPPRVPFAPRKVGVDKGTSIEEGELFDFEAEAQPVIDVLVDSSLEQGMLEAHHQAELAEMRRQQEIYLAEREREMAELRRLEQEEIRIVSERRRRLRQDQIARKLDEEMTKRIAAAKLLQGHISSLIPDIMENIEDITETTSKGIVSKQLCPLIQQDVDQEVRDITNARRLLTFVIMKVIKERAKIYAGYSDDYGTFEECMEEMEEMEHECCVCEDYNESQTTLGTATNSQQTN